jgi:hypothetical protein
LKLNYQIDDDGDFKLTFRLDNGRSQVCFVNSKTEQFGTLEIREVWSVGYLSEGAIDARLGAYLLTRNNRVKLGAWRISERSDGKVLIVFAAHVAAEMDAESLQSAMRGVLREADELEEKLEGTDRF